MLHNLASGDLSPSKVRGLIRNGWEVDSHTITHIDLTTVGAAQLRTELVDSKRQLHSRFGVPADFFCYPAGRYDDQVVAAVKAAGYLAATTENEGYGRPESMFTLARIRVNDTDTRTSAPPAIAAPFTLKLLSPGFSSVPANFTVLDAGESSLRLPTSAALSRIFTVPSAAGPACTAAR